VPAPSSRRIPLATGLRYHVLEWGAEDPALDHTVVLLHGFLDIAWSWQATAEAGLAGQFHVVAPDLRGHGDSDRVGAGGYYYFPDYLADLHALVPLVARRRLSLVGHSMGGSVASYYAGTYPDKVHRLALLEGTGPPETAPPGPDRIRAWLSACQKVRERAHRGYGSVEEAAARLQANDALLDPELARALAERGTIRGPDGRLRFKHDPLHATPGPFGFQLEVAERFWRAITCPVLLVEGAESAFRHAAAEAARRAARFAHAQSVTLPGAGHMMQRHQPAALAQLLAQFLAG